VWPCPKLSRPSARSLASMTSPRVAPPRVTCGPWAAMCAADSARRCITALGGPSPCSLPITTWIWSGVSEGYCLPDEDEATLAEVQRLDAAVAGPSAVLASSFEVEILPPMSPSEVGPHLAEGGDSAEGGDEAEGATPPPGDA
jgi:hypothetical protein